MFEVSLTSRRNCVVYLNELLQLFGATDSFVQSKFLELQRVFLKYIFDKKATLSEIASKALTLIYRAGGEDVKESLVQSLTVTLTGEASTQQVAREANEDKHEDRELLLDFNDAGSADQRKKLRTYKDLCKIASEMGHTEMIYQFMEVHRHHSRYQDTKNAAQGLSEILKLDDRLKADLMKIVPKILMLTYDVNEGVRDTMKQLWCTLIDAQKETQAIEEKW